MIVLSMQVIEDAFQQILGRLAPTILQECIDEFAGTYPVLGTEEAFKNALTVKAPSVDISVHDNLFIRFEGALRLAQAEQKEEERRERERQEQRRKEANTEEEKRLAREEAENLKREVSDKTSEFRRVQGELRNVNRDVLEMAMDIRQLARDSDYAKADSVVSALEALDEIAGKDGEVERFVKDASDIANQIPEASRSGDTATIDGSIMAVEALRDHLRDVLAVKMPSARTAVQAAITAAENAKTAEEAKAALKTIVDKAKADLDAIDGAEGIAKKVEAAVRQYKLDYIAQNGDAPNSEAADPLNPDKLTEAANDALSAAKTANDDVVREAEAENQDATQTAATRVADERTNAQAALDDITRRSSTLKQAEAIEGAKEVYVGKIMKKTEEEKAKKTGRLNRYLSSWQGHLTLFGLFLVGIVLNLLFFPWWVQIGVILAALVVLGGYGFSFLKGKPENGVVALGGHFVVVVVLLLFLALSLLIGKGPGSNRNLLPSEPTVAPTSIAQPVGDRPSQAELDAEATATAEASATEATDNP